MELTDTNFTSKARSFFEEIQLDYPYCRIKKKNCFANLKIQQTIGREIVSSEDQIRFLEDQV